MSADDKPVYWVSFLDGLQRVLLFTEDFKLAYKASQVRQKHDYPLAHYFIFQLASSFSCQLLHNVVYQLNVCRCKGKVLLPSCRPPFILLKIVLISSFLARRFPKIY